MAQYVINYRKLYKVLVGVMFLVLLVGIPTIIYTLFFAPKVQAGWYDDTWQYRQKVTVSNSGSALTNYQTSFTLDTSTLISANKMQSDCDDIRVTGDSGNLLAHWVDKGNKGCNTSTTIVWVKLASIPTAGTVLYVYYGNATAINIENGDSIFDFFDDFSGTTLDAVKWSSTTLGGTGAITVTGGTVDVKGGTAGVAKIQSSKSLPATAAITEYRMKVTTQSTKNRDRMSPFPISDRGIFYNSTNMRVYWNGFTSTVISSNTYYRFKQRTDGSTFWWDITDDSGGAVYSNSVASVTDQHNMRFSSGDDDNTMGGEETVDYYFARKYATTEPTAALSAEEKGQGPLAYLKFDEGIDNSCSGGANDLCNSMNDTTYEPAFGATTAAPTWKTEDNCLSGKCIYFDGSNDIASDTSFGSFDADFTVSLWLKAPPQTSGNNRFLEMSQGASAGFNMFMLSTGSINSDNTGGPSAENNSAPGFGDMKWHHVVATRSGTTYSLYVDGKFCEANGGTAPTYTRLYLGTQLSGSTFWTGFMDEVKVYNYARSPAQILTDYASRGAPKGVAATLGANKENNPAISSGLVGYWKMDESSGNAADSSGLATTMTNTNVATYTTGKFGNAGTLASASSQYFTAADNAYISMGDIDTTFTAWVNATTLAANRDILTKWGGAGTNAQLEWQLMYDNSASRFIFTVGDGTNIGSVAANSFGTPTTSTWYFIVAQHDSVNNLINISVNGGPMDSSSWSTGIIDNTYNMSIGRAGANNFNYWNGKIDEVRMYKRLLSPAEIAVLYGWAPGPVGYWKLDENTGTSTAYDSSGGGTNLTLTSIIQSNWAPGKYGSSLNLDGAADYAANSSSTPTTQTGIWSLEAWINPKSLSQLGLAVYNGNDSGGYGFGVGDGAGNSGSKLQGLFGGVAWYDSGYTFPSINQWYHIAMARDGTTTRMYVNGVQTTTTSASTPGTVNSRMSVGMQYSGANAATRFFNGSVDDVRMYNYTRTPGQIAEDMNAGHPTGGSPIASQVGYWNLDEQQGQTAHDKGFGASNGTLGASGSASTDDPTWKTANSSSCKINGCASFDGGDFINMGDVSALEISTAGFSISAWAKSADWVDSGPEMILSKYTPDADGDYYLGVYQNKFRAGFFGPGSISKFSNSRTVPTNGQWYHLAATWSGVSTDPILLYVNGRLDYAIESNDTITTLTTSNAAPAKIGARRTTTEAFFNGQIDEVKFYNSGLTAAEVLLDYNAGSATSLGGVLGTQNSEGFALPDTTGNWTMDENTDNTCVGGTNDVCDRSGNGYDGAITGAVWQPGKIGSALKFDGVDDNVSLPLISMPNNTDFTISLWAKIDSSQSGSTIGLFSGCTDPSASPVCTGGDYDGVLLRKDSSDRLWLSTYFFRSGSNSCSFITSTTVPLGQWVYLAATFDENDASSVGTLYMNGVKQPLTTSDCTGMVSAATSFYGAIGAIKLSNNGASTTYSGFTNGFIDNVKFYFDDLTQAQVSYDYNRGAPYAWYRFDECQGATAYNAAPAGSGLAAGNDGTISAGASGNTTVGTCGSGTSTEMWNDGTTGKINGSLGFDGTDDIVDVSVSAGLLSATEDYSLSAWIYPTDITSVTVYGQGNSANTVQAFRFGLDNNSKLMLSLINDSDVATSIVSNSSIAASTWTHIVATKNGSNAALYINGVLDKSVALSTSGSYTFNTTSIGYLNRLSDIEYVTGQIDDLRVYQYALTASQVLQVKNNGAVFFGPATGSP